MTISNIIIQTPQALSYSQSCYRYSWSITLSHMARILSNTSRQASAIIQAGGISSQAADRVNYRDRSVLMPDRRRHDIALHRTGEHQRHPHPRGPQLRAQSIEVAVLLTATHTSHKVTDSIGRDWSVQRGGINELR